MSDEHMHTEVPEPAEVRIEPARRGWHVSIVWLVPLIAAVVGAWLAYRTLSEQGPTVTIVFQNGEGLEAGKTKIKYKDVEVGQVETISLDADLASVVVTATLVKDMEQYLTDRTRFWVVRARVTSSGVTGLGTLISGAYIGIDPHAGGRKARDFTGLEVPPVLTRDSPGQHFRLRAADITSIQVGSPVHYRHIKVGEVVSYALEPDGRSVVLEIFVNQPYDRFVLRNTRFWNVSGLDVRLDADGVQLNTESVASLLVGGIAFGLPPNAPPSDQAAANTLFTLFSNQNAAFRETYTLKSRWLLNFESSVRGLSPGAPVEFRGIRIGRVVDVSFAYDAATDDLRIPVIIEVELERIFAFAQDAPTGPGVGPSGREVLNRLVERGLRAQLRTGNLVTGQLYVAFDIHKDAPAEQIRWDEPLAELPTLPSDTEAIAQDIKSIAQRLAAVPLDDIGTDVAKTVTQLTEMLTELRGLLDTVNTRVAPAAADTLKQTQQTLASIEETLGRNSTVRSDLETALEDLSKAARSLRVLADYLERHPEALLRGKTDAQR